MSQSRETIDSDGRGLSNVAAATRRQDLRLLDDPDTIDDEQTTATRPITTTISYYEQSNRARYSFVLSKNQPTDARRLVCRLRTGAYFYMSSRCDESLNVTETSLTAIVRTALFMYVFSTAPTESMYDMVFTGNVNHEFSKTTRAKTNLELTTVVQVLDTLFGRNFCAIAHRPVTVVYYEYHLKWKLYNYGGPVQAPSARNYIETYRFCRVPVQHMTPVTEFVLSRHNLDHKIPLQQSVKRLSHPSVYHK